jgi:hypothetical protein
MEPMTKREAMIVSNDVKSMAHNADVETEKFMNMLDDGLRCEMKLALKTAPSTITGLMALIKGGEEHF